MSSSNRLKRRPVLKTKLVLIIGSLFIAGLTGILIYFLSIGKPEKSYGAPTTIGGVINNYARVTAISGTTFTIDNVTNAAAFSAESKVMIIQMKGATVSSSSGVISSYNNAGVYELTVISAITGTGPSYSITVNQILNSYTVSGQVQLVTVPQYIDAMVTSNITGTAWNSTLGRGGIITFEVQNTLTLQANIIADGMGFAGGIVNPTASMSSDPADNSTLETVSGTYAQKGEAISNYRPRNRNSFYYYGMGALANGGGGGNIHNAGGGGGSNYTAGGSGGSSYPGAGTGGNGKAAYALNYFAANNQIFMGGGGGGGQQNNNFGSAGANGGGIILIRAGILASPSSTLASYSITSNGSSANNSTGNDGAGGGGGGGTIFLDVMSYNMVSSLTISANGGNGGTVGSGLQHGGGGGGGIGAVLFSVAPNSSMVTVASSPGTAGRDCSGAGCIATGSSGAPCTTGCTGMTGWSVVGQPILLPVNLVTFKGVVKENKIIVSWITAEEHNNNFFTLEKSEDGILFEEVATIKAVDETSQMNNYSHIDDSPFAGNNYYRLKQTDINGQENYLTTISVNYKSLTDKNLSISSISPNPFSDYLKVDFNLQKAVQVRLEIKAATGKTILTKSISGISGKNSYEFREGNSLIKGVYVVGLYAEGEHPILIKIIKN